MRVAVVVLGVEPDQLQQLLHGRLVPARASTPWSRNGAPTIVPTVCRGFSDEYGSWKIICMSRRSGRSCALRQVGDVAALEVIRPAGRLQQPDEQPAGGGLAAARLAHQAERLALARPRSRARRRP